MPAVMPAEVSAPARRPQLSYESNCAGRRMRRDESLLAGAGKSAVVPADMTTR